MSEPSRGPGPGAPLARVPRELPKWARRLALAATLCIVSSPLTAYLIDSGLDDPAEAERACHAVLQAVIPRVETAFIDAYTDVDELPTHAKAAQAALFEMGRARGEGDPGMAIDLDVSQPEHVRLLYAFASWSIGTELYDDGMRWVAYISDTASSVSFNVTEEEAVSIRAALKDIPMITHLEHDRRRP